MGTFDWTAAIRTEDQRAAKEGRGEDDKNIFFDRYKFSRWVKTE